MNDSIRLCTVEGCTNKHKGRGYCNMHLGRLLRNGSPELQKHEMKSCSVEGCALPYRCSGFCSMHYARMRSSGTAGPAERILSPANQDCERDGCDRPSKSRGVCEFHSRRDKILATVAANPARRINSWATTEDRLRRAGWTEVVHIPALGACWEWAGSLDRNGYGRVAVKGRKMRSAHRESYGVWVGPLTDEEYVCHRCDNPPCMNPAHLFLGDQFANMGDSVSKGRNAYGIRQGGAKLTDAKVLDIRAKYRAGGHTYKSLGNDFDVSAGAIQAIVTRRNWKHLP